MVKKKPILILLYFIFFTQSLNLKCNASDINISAKSAILMCADSNSIIWAKDEHRKLPIASTTKIMTSILTIEQIEACGNSEIEITDEMVRVEGTSMGLMPKDVVTLESLVKGMLLCSGNDAANAASIAVSGEKEKFIDLMNDKAKQIGMLNTRFVTPSGLDQGDHHSTAYDMALLGSYAMENESFANIASKKSMKVEFISPNKTVNFKNHNKLLRLYEGCIGIKTGFTKAAGRCLVSCAQKNGVRLVAVTLNAPSDWDDHMKLYDYGFENTISKTFDDQNINLTIKVDNSDTDTLELNSSTWFSKTFKKGDENKVIREIELPEFCQAPIQKGQIIGKVNYHINGKIIGSNDLTASKNIEAKPIHNFWSKVSDFFKGLFN